MNKAASELGKRGKGIKKTLSEAERERRRQWGKKLNEFKRKAAESCQTTK